MHHRHLGLLDQMQRAVQARFTTGGAGLADAVRVDLETAKTRRAIVRINGDIARARATLNALLRRPATAALGAPRETGTETVRLSLEELVARARSVRGTSLSAQARTRAAQARQEAAEAEASTPELMVGLGYWQAPAMRAGFGANVSISLPWLWGPGGERVAEAREQVAAERAGQDLAMVEAMTEISESRAQLDSNEQELRALHEQAMPAAHHAVEAIRASYATGHANLLEWLDAARSLLDLEMEEADLSAEVWRAVAALERSVGSALPRTAISVENSR